MTPFFQVYSSCYKALKLYKSNLQYALFVHLRTLLRKQTRICGVSVSRNAVCQMCRVFKLWILFLFTRGKPIFKLPQTIQTCAECGYIKMNVEFYMCIQILLYILLFASLNRENNPGSGARNSILVDKKYFINLITFIIRTPSRF